MPATRLATMAPSIRLKRIAMKRMACLLAAGALAGAAHAAAPNPLSVHVLNLQDGRPAAGVEVVLEKQEDGRWTTLNAAATDAQGRIGALFPDGRAWIAGTYKVTFKTGKWFAGHRV